MCDLIEPVFRRRRDEVDNEADVVFFRKPQWYLLKYAQSKSMSFVDVIFYNSKLSQCVRIVVIAEFVFYAEYEKEFTKMLAIHATQYNEWMEVVRLF